MLKKFFELFSNAGTKFTENIKDKKRIILLNQITLLAIFFSLSYSIFYFVIGYFLLTIIPLIVSIGFLISYLINKSGKYKTSRLTLFLTALTAIFFSSSVYGKEMYLHLFLFPILAGVFTVFSVKERINIIICVISVFLTYALLEITAYQLLEFNRFQVYERPWVSYINFSTALFITALIVYHYYRINLNYENQIIRERNQLHTTIFSTEEGIWMLDREYNLIIFNNTFNNWVKEAFNENLIKGINIIELVNKYDKEIADFWKNKYNEVIKTKKNISFEANQYLGNNLKLIAEFTLNPVIENGEVIAISGFGKDISERMQMQKQLEIARCSAEEALHAKSIFLSNMSHELRTPINGIYGLTQMLLEKKQSKEMQFNLEIINNSASYLAKLIENILDYDIMDSGKLKLNISEFKLTELIQNIKQDYVPKFKGKQIEFSVDLKPDLPAVLSGDVKRIGMVIEKLLDNALKFTNQGYVNVLIDEKERTLKDVTLNISVEDSGIGIETEKLDFIFEAFNQIDNEKNRVNSSAGLGLTLSKKIIEAHGGKMYVKSTAGKGSVFGFELRLTINSASNNNVLEYPIKKIDFKDKKILIVDDNKINVLVAKKMVEQLNIKIIIAENGKEAIKKILKNKIDLVLLDLHMPEMDGFEVSKHIRNSEYKVISDIPIVAVSADILPETKIKAGACGMNDFIEKPYNFESMSKVIYKFLNDPAEEKIH